jgi:hypothetical protein
MASVYLETTIVSYLAAFPSRDLVIAARQQITQDWWQTARDRFDVFISRTVLDEISAGDIDAVKRRGDIVQALPILQLTADVVQLIEEYD